MRGWDFPRTWLLLAALTSAGTRVQAQPGAAGPALNFVREPGAESSLLIVVVITDEDDCSALD